MLSTLTTSFLASLLLTLTSASPIPQDEPSCITLPVIINELVKPFGLSLIYPDSPLLNDLLVHIPLTDSSDPYGAPLQLFVPAIGTIAERDDFAPTSTPVVITLKQNSLFQSGFSNPAQIAPFAQTSGLDEVYFQEFGLLDPSTGGFAITYGCDELGSARQELFILEEGANFCLKNTGGVEGSGDEMWTVLIKKANYDPAIDGACADVRLAIE
ncbi:hypothetical protein DFH27DRAFT_542390 [Peziza echinospora]|nr:hypothetical protein DFH27DRAFT_542390 [Peziza echinospora]